MFMSKCHWEFSLVDARAEVVRPGSIEIKKALLPQVETAGSAIMQKATKHEAAFATA
jgi:hypothetical protein